MLGRGKASPGGAVWKGWVETSLKITLGAGDKGVSSKWEGAAGAWSSAAGAGGAQMPLCARQQRVWGCNGAGACWALLVFLSETQAALPVSGEGEVPGAAVPSRLSSAASLRVEGFSCSLAFPKELLSRGDVCGGHHGSCCLRDPASTRAEFCPSPELCFNLVAEYASEDGFQLFPSTSLIKPIPVSMALPSLSPDHSSCLLLPSPGRTWWTFRRSSRNWSWTSSRRSAWKLSSRRKPKWAS